MVVFLCGVHVSLALLAELRLGQGLQQAEVKKVWRNLASLELLEACTVHIWWAATVHPCDSQWTSAAAVAVLHNLSIVNRWQTDSKY